MNLTLDERKQLVTGVGMWHTKEFPGKVPAILMTDGPHGVRKQHIDASGENNNSFPATCFPTASALACSFDPELVGKVASYIADEALSMQVMIILGCGINIKRSPLCGRNFEYFSEDPYLTGKLATSYINAMQQKGVGTSLKHFACNNQETHRQTSNSQVDERALHEIYLRAFEMVIKEANPATIMASYNRINGQYACENKELLTEILRKKWGFKGTVISDWGACIDLNKALSAGMDLEMPDSKGYHPINNDFPLEFLERASDNVAKLALSCNSTLNKAPAPFNIEKHNEMAVEAECESAVLLKNNGFLPIKKGSRVIVVGEMAEHMRYQGGGSSHINATIVPKAINALKNKGYIVTYVKGYRFDKSTSDESLENEALKIIASHSDVPVLFFGGLTEYFEGEGYDRTSLEMPENQIHLFNEIFKVSKNLAFIAFGGSAFTIPFQDKAQAILNMYLGGQGVGEAVARLISGECNPCGRLAETFPLKIKDVPSYENFGKDSDDVEYRESIFVGYRYYSTYGKKVLYPFGYGLSYTTFEYSKLDYNDNTVSFTLQNTGSVFGKEVSQIYIKNPKSKFLRESTKLAGFAKTALNPGEKKRVSIKLSDKAFCIYDTDSHSFITVPGNYEVNVCRSLEDICLSHSVNIEGKTYSRDDTVKFAEYFNQGTGIFHISQEQFKKLYGHELSHFDNIQKGNFTVYNSLRQLSKHSFLGKIFLNYAIHTAYKMYKGRPKCDPEIKMTIETIKDGTIDGVMCQAGDGVPYKFASAVVLSANGHPFKALSMLIRR